jgi:hypothetical protein
MKISLLIKLCSQTQVTEGSVNNLAVMLILHMTSYLYRSLSVSSGEIHSKPPAFIRVKIKTGLEEICTWLATWQAVKA